ncbi:hypothetical protein ACFQ1I_04610 [Kitasatospora arboriphila]
MATRFTATGTATIGMPPGANPTWLNTLLRHAPSGRSASPP